MAKILSDVENKDFRISWICAPSAGMKRKQTKYAIKTPVGDNTKVTSTLTSLAKQILIKKI